ncbi:conserved hypothetical protein (plasmid) [Rhodococcus jostii RHA1]|uniref:Uncharacterized protein n=1 Tax=Rhodococcus jostii (strain RHA1) TaxID=101510 RepID=Q0RXM0_RHOJR|nr:conserved hypothetical protein [Rhodococcus jostii RHA1]
MDDPVLDRSGRDFCEIADQVTDLEGDRAGIAARADEATARLPSTDSVWYLAPVGVGLPCKAGSWRAVLEPGLKAAKNQRDAADLETSFPSKTVADLDEDERSRPDRRLW